MLSVGLKADGRQPIQWSCVRGGDDEVGDGANLEEHMRPPPWGHVCCQGHRRKHVGGQ